MLWQSSSTYKNTPSSLAECLDQSSRRRKWRFWLIVIFLIPSPYYIKNLLASENSRFLQGPQNYDRIVMRAPKKIILAKPTTETTNISYVSEVATPNPTGVLPICVVDKSQLGNFSVKRLPGKVLLENQYPTISKGGCYSPVGCVSRHNVGVLVPYRDRKENLEMFLFNIHPFLMKQKLKYRIFVVEQKGAAKFNKGRVFNAGFVEMKKYGPWDCIVFHDVDLIPLDERILYSCPFWPRHMASTVIQKVYDVTYHSMFGGVTSMTPSQYEQVNGYSNLYWGWGAEDNDMFWRIRYAKLPVTRYNKSIARYTSLPHPTSAPNKWRFKILQNGLSRYMQEGLSTLEYKLVSVTEKHLYTHIVVDINPGKETVSRVF